MTIELDPVSSSGDAYISLDQADEYTLRVADITAWTAADDDAKSRALVQASDEIDTLLFAGRPYDADQARQFPRFVADGASEWPAGKLAESGVVWDLDDDGVAIVPEAVKRATFAQALTILRDPQRAARMRDQHDNVVSQSAGGASESYSGGRPRLVCLNAIDLLRPYLLKSGRIV
jgi:hypothetical protein